MFRENRRYISENETRDDYINLNLRPGSSAFYWDKAIEILRGRIKGRYLDPINTLVAQDANKNGFAAMALCCLLIETLLQFREGYPVTPRGNKMHYSNFLQGQMGDVFNRNTAERFYTDIRCGILHSAQTKNGSCLTFDNDYTVNNIGNGVMMVDVKKMAQRLSVYFDHYCVELNDPYNTVLRLNFIAKMNDVTRVWEGSDDYNNLWFAICEKEGKSIIKEDGDIFTFRVVNRGESLLINERLRISRRNIEQAANFLPNKEAIKMVRNSSLILPILNLCSDVIDDLIQNKTA